MKNRLSKFLKQPYPDRDDIASMIAGAVVVGFIVALVLYILKPFNLDRAGSKLLTYCVQFGLISAGVSILFDLVIRFIFRIRRDTERWTFWKWLLTVTVLIMCIALANYVFIATNFNNAFNLKVFFKVLYSTFLIGLFPVAIFGSYNLVRQLKANEVIAAAIIPHPSKSGEQSIDLPIHNSSKTFVINAASILYAEAMQNYVCIHYTNEDGLQKEMIRNTIQAIETALSKTSVKRCHRSYLVNEALIEAVSGNAQGLKLKLSGLDKFEIPVSRKYIDHFRD